MYRRKFSAGTLPTKYSQLTGRRITKYSKSLKFHQNGTMMPLWYLQFYQLNKL